MKRVLIVIIIGWSNYFETAYMTTATIAQRNVPHAISARVNAREYPLINVRFVKSYIAYERSPMSAPYPSAVWHELASHDLMTKT